MKLKQKTAEQSSSPSVSGRSPAGKRFLVNFKLKIAHLVRRGSAMGKAGSVVGRIGDGEHRWTGQLLSNIVKVSYE